MRRVLLVALLGGCYRPQNAACVISCESSAQCPSGLVCGAAGRCGEDLAACASEPGSDAAPLADGLADSSVPPSPDAQAFCYMPKLGAATPLCVSSTTDVLLVDTIDTGTSPLCDATQSTAATCVIQGNSIAVMANVRVDGTRALILVARGAIQISGAVNASSSPVQHGPGRNDACPTKPGSASATFGGGGAGGGGQGTGGGGGGASGGAVIGGASSSSVPVAVKGGCQGGLGGVGGTSSSGGALGGGGGGAVYLIAQSIGISANGSINASGGGGQGGALDGGGAGGGAGGLIALQAASIMVAGDLFATGGGGGGGGSTTSPGIAGGEPMSAASGGQGGAAAAGSGAGASAGTLSGGNGGTSAASGGGGAGASGYIETYGAVTASGQIVPPAIAHP